MHKIDPALRSITGTAYDELRACIAQMKEQGLMPETDRARLCAAYDTTLMLSADQLDSHPPRPISMKMIVDRLKHG